MLGPIYYRDLGLPWVFGRFTFHKQRRRQKSDKRPRLRVPFHAVGDETMSAGQSKSSFSVVVSRAYKLRQSVPAFGDIFSALAEKRAVAGSPRSAVESNPSRG